MSDYDESQDVPESSDLPSEPQDASNSPAIQRSTRSYMDVASSDIPSTPPPPPASSSMPPPSTIPKKRRRDRRESEAQEREGIDDTLEFIEIDESGERKSSPKRQKTVDPDDGSEKPELILEHAEPNFRAGPVFHYPRLYEEIEYAKNRGVDVGPSGGVVIKYEPFEGRGVTPPPGSENWTDPKPQLYSTMEDIEEIYTLHSMQQPEESELEVQATPGDKQETETTDQPQSPLAAPPVEVQDVEITDVRSIGGTQGKKNVSGTQSQSVSKTDPPGHPTIVAQDVQVIEADDQPLPPPPAVSQTQAQGGITAGQPAASAAAGTSAKSVHPEQSTEGVLAVAPQVATAPPVLPMGDTMAAKDGAQTQGVGYTPAQPPYSLVTQHHSPSQQDGAETNPQKPAAGKEGLLQMLGEEIVKMSEKTNEPLPKPPPSFKEPKKREVDIRRIGKHRLEKAFQYMGVCRRMRTWAGPPESASIQRPPNMNLSALPRHPGFSRPARRDSSSAASKTHKAPHTVKTEPDLARNVLMETVEGQGPGRRSARTASQKTQIKTTSAAVPTSSVAQAEPPTRRTSRQPSVASGTELRRSTRKTTAPAGSRASSVESTRSGTTKKGAKKVASKAPRELEVVVEEEDEEEEEGEEQGEEREQAQEEERNDDDDESEAEDSPSPSPPPVTTQKGKGKAGTKGVTKAATAKKTGTAQGKTAAKGAKAKTTTKTTKASTAKRGGKKTTAEKS